MAYSPFEVRVYPIFIYYLVLIIFSAFLTYKIYLKWRERRVPPPLYITVVFGLLTTALVVLTIGLLEAIITGYYME
ncbi:MAG: hypothetical protein EU544_05555, partial [Promethearchaeota archaeon]